MIPGPGSDLLFLGENDDLAMFSDLQQQVEDFAGAGRVCVHRNVVENERTGVVILG
jgi:hypothetical protein